MDLIPFDILVQILSYVPFKGSNRLYVIVSCKRFSLASKKAFDPSERNNYSIRWASKKGYLNLVQDLLKDKRVDPTAKNNEALKKACLGSHTKVIRELLNDERVNPCSSSRYCIRMAIQNCDLNVINELLKDSRVTPIIDDIRDSYLLGCDEIAKELSKRYMILYPKQDPQYLL